MALLPVEEALKRILSGVKPGAVEKIRLADAPGRALARHVAAKRDQPPFDASAMDGYALRHADQDLGQPLLVSGVSAAGHRYRWRLEPGEAVRILTGAPLPHGADTIVIQENVRLDGDQLSIIEPAALGKNIRRRGLDFKRGNRLVDRGKVLAARDIALLAAGNAADVSVYRRPRLVLFTTGDELVLPGQTPRADQIFSSNSHALRAMAESFGAEVVNLGIVRDSLKATQAAVQKGLGADILVTTGGASVGDHDYVQEAFRRCGVKIGFWKIAMRPGKPFMYGRKGKCHVMGLPGNPVSALVTARLFLIPLITARLGLPQDDADVRAVLESDMPANDGRQDYVRATLATAADGRRTARPFSVQDSSMQRTLHLAHCLIVRPPHAPAAKAGDAVPLLILDF